MTTKTVFITNTDGAFGFSLVYHYVTQGCSVFATCPRPEVADKLYTLSARYPGRLTIVQLDVTNRDQVATAHTIVEAKAGSLDVLINNTELNAKLYLDSLENAAFAFRMNAIAPIMIARKFVDLLQRSDEPKIANIMASDLDFATDETTSNQAYTYSTSKQALKLYSQALATELASQNILVRTFDLGCLQSPITKSDEVALRPIIATTAARIAALIDCPSTHQPFTDYQRGNAVHV
jgi:NAD(P)-dependent dehydrogenase (short-subunit alcohol dehydrogenase family)